MMEQSVRNAAPILRARDIAKRYGGVQALKGVNFDLYPGEIHALVGENGAGKSTLIKILSGYVAPSDGQLEIGSAPAAGQTPAEARARGIATVYQDRVIAAHLTVAENILMGDLSARLGRLDWPTVYRRSQAALNKAGAGAIDPRRRAGSLSGAEQLFLEVARALARTPRVLILDEPTAGLGQVDAEHLFELLRDLAASGLGIVYISHHLKEVLALADRITVLRDGASVAVFGRDEAGPNELVSAMAGKEVAHLHSARAPADLSQWKDEVVIDASDLSGPGVRSVSFRAHRGEILGIGGMVGSGRSELLHLLYGIARPTGGQATIAGRPAPSSPQEAVAKRMALVSEDRLGQMLLRGQAIADNMMLAQRAKSGDLWVSRRRALEIAQDQKKRLSIRMGDAMAPVTSLSGGNQQKVVLARWLVAGFDVLLLDEPTQGVDVGAKTEIHDLITKEARAGKCVVVVSSDAAELVAISDRVLVMRKGRLAGELTGDAISETRIVALAAGSKEEVE